MRNKIAALAFGLTSLASAAAFAQQIHIQGPRVGSHQLPSVTVGGAPVVVQPQYQPGYGQGYYQPGYQQGYQPGYQRPGYQSGYYRPAPGRPGFGGGPNHPGFFAQQTRAQVDAISNDIRRDIRRGDVHPVAESHLNQRRALIDDMLSRFSRDGMITPDEREHVQDQLRQLSNLDRQFDISNTNNRGFGGGPRGWRR